ncbi:MAG TPA: sigma factor-like helix-turn-helix DNA-binding protein [Candidatus Kapabacteria bacterium]
MSSENDLLYGGSKMVSQQQLPTADRNKAIVAQRKAGQSLEAIGDQYGITKERVRQIVDYAHARKLVPDPKTDLARMEKRRQEAKLLAKKLIALGSFRMHPADRVIKSIDQFIRHRRKHNVVWRIQRNSKAETETVVIQSSEEFAVPIRHPSATRSLILKLRRRCLDCQSATAVKMDPFWIVVFSFSRV